MNTAANHPPVLVLSENPGIPPKRVRRGIACLLAGFAAVHFCAAAENPPMLVLDALVVGAGDISLAGDSFPPPPLGSLVIEAGTLVIAGSGVLDLRNNKLIVRTGNFATIYGYVLNGFNGGAWNGVGGINSRTAAEDTEHLTAVGILNNAEAGYTTWAGRTLSLGTETLAEYTYIGDANLDGTLDDLDLALFGTGSGWYHGDFNYDGAVNATDLALFYATRQALTGEAPEPGTLALLAVGTALLPGRRKRSA